MKNNSVYIHIPFCTNICSYCDFCKLYYNKKFVKKYLISLENEIKLNYKGELIKTLYIGGGTPSSLDINELKKLFEIIKTFNFDKEYEFTIECNIENIDEEKLILFKNNNVNRISYGIQTFNHKFLKYLNRNHTKEDVINKINLTKKYFNNINIDLIYALKEQTLNDLEKDIDFFLKLNINHISTYSLIIEPHTKLYINKEKNIDEDLDYEMYRLICNKLKENHFVHYEVSNFAKKGYESKHNLTYWNNLNYYGFGLGASGYIDNIRYTNTKDINKYCNGKYLLEYDKLSNKEIMENELILGLRKLTGISIKEFKKKYNKNIEDVFNISNLIKEGKLVKKNNNLYINEDNIYLSNDVLINFIGDLNE